jgi:hypothetical protein
VGVGYTSFVCSPSDDGEQVLVAPLETIFVFFLSKHYFYSVPKTNYLLSGEITSWYQLSCGSFMGKR